MGGYLRGVSTPDSQQAVPGKPLHSKDYGLPVSAQMEGPLSTLPWLYTLALPNAIRNEGRHSTVVGNSGYSGDICDPPHPSTRDKSSQQA